MFVLCGRHHSIRSVENDPKLPRVRHGGLTVPPYGAEHAKLLKMAARTHGSTSAQLIFPYCG